MNTRSRWPLAVIGLLSLLIAGCAEKEGGTAGDGGGGGDGLQPPTMLTATIAAPTTVLLTWQDNSSNETGFLIERQAGAGEFREVARTAANVKEYRDSTVSARRDYLYRVAALNAQNMRSAFTDEITIDVP